MKKIKIIAMLFIATLVFVSCQNEDTLDAEAVSKEKYPEIAAKLKKMHFSAEGLEIIDLELPDGTKQKMFNVEGDIAFSRKHIENAKTFIDIKQYRASSIVLTPWWGGTRTLKIMGYTGGTFALSNKERTALSWSVSNYNVLNLKINFDLSFGTDLAPQDIVVYRNSNIIGGQSGFPSNGDPYKWISIGGLSSFSYNYNECVITHNIGHVIGMQHTYNTSCGVPRPIVFRIHIPGTPWGADPTSIYNPCCPSTTTGELSYYDRVALNYLY